MSGGVFGIETDIEDFEDAERFSIQRVRDACMDFRITGVRLPGELLREGLNMFMATNDEVERVADMAHEAVAAGRLIDFGDIPNKVLMATAKRAGPMYNRRWIGHPFRDPWVFYHTWDGHSAAYLINPLESDPDLLAGNVELCELQGMTLHGEFVLLIGDRAMLFAYNPDDPTQKADKFHVSAVPSVWRVLGAMRGEPILVGPGANHSNPIQAAAENVLDPMVTALMILNTRNVDRVTVPAPVKLNKARRAKGRSIIPAYDVVNTKPYVTAIQAGRPSGERGASQGGTHRSPVPHLRMGHPRTYKSGTVSFIRDTLVNFDDAARANFFRTRSHYSVR